MHPKRPPFAQLLYDIGLEQDFTPINVTALSSPLAQYPPVKSTAPMPLYAMHLPLLLHLLADPAR